MSSKEAIDKSFKFLLISRAARSTALIFGTLSIPLYLLVLQFSIVVIGLLYFFMTMFTVLLIFLVGMLGDRIGYRNALIIGEIPPLIVMVIFATTTNPAFVIIATVLGGVGGAPGAMRGAFSPGTVALVARNWPKEQDRITRLAKVTFVGSVSAVGGSIFLVLHGFIEPYVGSAGAFRILYTISAILVAVSIISLSMLKEGERIKKPSRFLQKESGAYTLKVITTNLVNGSALGLSISLLPAWFALMYHSTSTQIGALFSVSYIATAIGSYTASRVSFGSPERTLLAASVARVVQGLILVPMAFMPYFYLAGIIYAVRSAVAGFGTPTRMSINVSGIKGGDFGTATSLQGISGRASQGTSGAAGYLMDYYLPLPLVTGGLIQAFAGLFYYKMFSKSRKEASPSGSEQ